jgi:hypothetical protein
MSEMTFDFSLADKRATNGGLRFTQEAEMNQLWPIFPGTLGIRCQSNFPTFTLETLPEKPWPTTIAGASCFFRLEDGPMAYSFCTLLQGNGEAVLTDINARGHLVGQDLERVLTYFGEAQGDNLISLRYCFNHFQIIVKSTKGCRTWATKVAGLSTMYSDEAFCEPYPRHIPLNTPWPWLGPLSEEPLPEYEDDNDVHPGLRFSDDNDTLTSAPIVFMDRYCDGVVHAIEYKAKPDDEANKYWWREHLWLWHGQGAVDQDGREMSWSRRATSRRQKL